VLWHPGSNYDAFVPALARTLASRASKEPTAAKLKGD
jgi:hypothetical protein